MIPGAKKIRGRQCHFSSPIKMTELIWNFVSKHFALSTGTINNYETFGCDTCSRQLRNKATKKVFPKGNAIGYHIAQKSHPLLRFNLNASLTWIIDIRGTLFIHTPKKQKICHICAAWKLHVTTRWSLTFFFFSSTSASVKLEWLLRPEK